MSEKKNKERRRESILKYDSSVESPEEVIAADKDQERKSAFQEAYKKIAMIIPEYFKSQQKKRKNSTSGGTSFSQNIVVTPEKATVQTKEVANTAKEQVQNENEKERE